MSGRDRIDSAEVRAIDLFVHELVVGLVLLDVCAPETDDVQMHVATLAHRLRQVLADEKSRTLALELSENEIWHEHRPLVGASLQAGALLRLCHERRVATLGFAAGLTPDEILRFLLLLRSPSDLWAFHPNHLAKVLESRGLRHVHVLLRGQEPPDAAGGAEAARRPALRRYQAMADYLQRSHAEAVHGHELDTAIAKGLVEQALEDMDREPSSLLSLATYDDVDTFTVGHSVRVALLALHVARAAGASRGQQLRIGTAALLHDVGKSRVPNQILFKQGRLSREERAVMMQHARFGAEILLEQKGLDPSAIGAAYCHHMGPQGHGYPGPVLPFEPSGVSKLVRVCDVFEALTAVRPYKRALSPLEAYTVMFRMEHGFDPAWLEFFVKSVGLYPDGTRVRIDGDREAVVVGQGENPTKPRLRLLDSGAEVSLTEPIDGRMRKIQQVLS